MMIGRVETCEAPVNIGQKRLDWGIVGGSVTLGGDCHRDNVAEIVTATMSREGKLGTQG